MATLPEIQTDLCVSGIGKQTNPVSLMQITAQLLADQLQVSSPGTSVTPDAIMARACTSGIADVQNPQTLLILIAQLLNDLQP